MLRSLEHHGIAGAEMWLVDLDAYACDRDLDGLSASEYERASRSVTPRGATRALASRHAVRHVLAKLSNCSPQQLLIEPDEHGKPRLLGRDDFHFNLSHSEHLCLIAVSHRSIGVDIEITRAVAGAAELTRSCFTDAERGEWSRSSSRDRAFLTCWTRKEACLKAIGVGLSLRAIEVDVGCSSAVRDVPMRTMKGIDHVTVRTLDIGPDAVAAVAVVNE